MTQGLLLEQHIRLVAEAAADLADRTRAAGLDAAVPACPRWRVSDLVAHQGIVHRWATSHLLGTPEYHVSKAAVLADVESTNLVAWLEDGAAALVEALRAAPADLRAMVFLRDAPAPREFWARRQAHETTIHSVDALAAALGRPPMAAETGVDAEVALDGLDELLCGFVPRGRSKLRTQSGATLVVMPEEGETAWCLQLGERIHTERVSRLDPRVQVADSAFTGTAAQLYLGLWNRGAEAIATDSALLADWHDTQRVRWS